MMLRSYNSLSSSEGGGTTASVPRSSTDPYYNHHDNHHHSNNNNTASSLSHQHEERSSSSMRRNNNNNNTRRVLTEEPAKGSIRGVPHEWERVQEIQRIQSKARHLRSSRSEDGSLLSYQSLRSNNSSNCIRSGTQQRSHRADQAERYLLQDFHSPRRKEERVVSPTSTAASSSNASTNLALHDLCGEAVSVDDVAWRNAVHLLSQNPELAMVQEDSSHWTPLHICCLSNTPKFMMVALLHVHPESACIPDDGGRLPLHLLAATLADVELMELVVSAYQNAVSTTDHHGCTPLQLLLRNKGVAVTFRHVQVLLGMTGTGPNTASNSTYTPLVRRGEHLDLSLAELSRWRQKAPVVTNFLHHNDIKTDDYPNDVAVALRTLANWKASNVEVPWSPETSDVGPAEIPNHDGEFPIHVVIQRAFVDKAPLEVSQREEDDEQSDEENRPAKGMEPSIHHATSIVRLLAAECPASLTVRDTRGMTPLLHILQMPEIDTELVETLLGKRFPQFDTTMNAAMLAHPETRQLPLHIVAEEYASDYSMIRAVAEAHPFAKGVQDERGRTPLHLALHSYRRIPADPRVLDLLYKDSIATVVDDYGNTPAHLLLQSKSLPKAESDIYQRIFAASSTTFELSELRKLPSWLRAEACATREIQELIIRDLAQPWKTAVILFDGILLVLLIAVFRIQMKQYVDYLNIGDPIQPWYTFVVYVVAILRLIGQVLLGVVAAAIGEFRHLFAWNIWYWIGIVAAMFCLVTSAQLYGSVSPQRLLLMGTASTCLLWISLLGYMATWFHGMAVFAGAFGWVARRLVFPLLTAVALFIGFSQCFYTLLQLDCSDALGGPPVCTERDAYRVVYHLVRGIPISAPTEPVQLSSDAVLLVAMLISLLLMFSVAFVVTLFISSSSVSFENVSLTSYWEPKLAMVVAPEDFNLERSTVKAKRSVLSSKLGELWEALNEISKQDSDERTSWHAIPRNSFDFLYGFIVIPLWCLIGLLSCGLLWPYQVREWLYRPDRAISNNISRFNQPGDQAFSLREEIADLKHSSYEKSSELKKEIRQLKEILLMAIDDE